MAKTTIKYDNIDPAIVDDIKNGVHVSVAVNVDVIGEKINYEITTDREALKLVDGLKIQFVTITENTGTSLTLKINDNIAYPIVVRQGNILPGTIEANKVINCIFDSSGNRFLVSNSDDQRLDNIESNRKKIVPDISPYTPADVEFTYNELLNIMVQETGANGEIIIFMETGDTRFEENLWDNAMVISKLGSAELFKVQGHTVTNPLGITKPELIEFTDVKKIVFENKSYENGAIINELIDDGSFINLYAEGYRFCEGALSATASNANAGAGVRGLLTADGAMAGDFTSSSVDVSRYANTMRVGKDGINTSSFHHTYATGNSQAPDKRWLTSLKVYK